MERSPEALELCKSWGADHTVLVDGTQVAKGKDITNGQGVQAVIDFVGEGGAIEDGGSVLRRAGSYHVIGYGGQLQGPRVYHIITEGHLRRTFVGTNYEL